MLYDDLEKKGLLLDPVNLDRPIKVVSWNVCWRSNKAEVLEVLREIDADILLLQELTFEEPEDTIEGHNQALPIVMAYELGLLVSYLPCRIRRTRRWGVLYECIAVFSRFPATFVSQNMGESKRAPGKNGLHNSRDVIIADVHYEGWDTSILFTSVHRSYTLPFGYNRAGLEDEDRNFLEYVDRIVDTGHSAVLAGDFNTTGAPILGDIEARGFKHTGPSYGVPSWVGPPKIHWLTRALALGERLDYAFTDIPVVSAELLSPGPSDHRPLVFEIDPRRV